MKLIMDLLIIFAVLFQIQGIKAGWCYFGGCHRETGIFEKACPSMADNVGRDNMYLLGHKKCDKWHERLWGKRYYCCTKDCMYQKCGNRCATLGKKDAEEDFMERRECSTTYEGKTLIGFQYFCCDK